MSDGMAALAIVLGCVGVVSSLILGAVLLITTVVLYRRIRRLERAVKRTKKREHDLEQSTAQLTHSSLPPSSTGNNGRLDTSFTRPSALPVTSDNGGRITYENTEISVNENHVEKPSSSGIPTTSDNYNDVVSPLPSFLRNETMLVTPAHVVSQDQSGKTTPPKIETPPTNHRQDYMDPQDAKSLAASKRTSEKLDEMSKGIGKELPAKLTTKPVDRVNYSEVLDALPHGSSVQKAIPDDLEEHMRSRTSSDAAVILGPPGPKDETYFKKTQSLRRDVSPDRVPYSAQLGRRRSTAKQKEMVTFDPSTAAFKLEKKSSNHSDGTSSKTSSSQSSPTGEHIQPGDMFLDVGGKHVYAAVDLSVKCRPDDDILRREGVGTPDHYVACIN